MDWIDILITFLLLGAGLIGNLRKKPQQRAPQGEAPPEDPMPETSVQDLIDALTKMRQEVELSFPEEEELVQAPAPKVDVVEEAIPQTVSKAPSPVAPQPVPQENAEQDSQNSWSPEELKKLVLYSEIMKPKFTES